jgi:anti-anti-sigma factor
MLHARPHQWDGHLLLLHDSEAQRRTGVAAWVRRGLARGEKILYTEPATQDRGHVLTAVLEEQQVDVGGALESGQLQVVLADSTAYDPAWQMSVIEDALHDGYPSVRWAGEAATAWGVMSRRVHAEVEQTTDDLCRSQPLSVLCQYPTSAMSLPQVCSFHGAGVRNASLTAASSADAVHLSGEVDISNHELLHAVLLARTSTARGTTYTLDLSELTFLDVTGTRAIVSGTYGYRSVGGHVRIRTAHRPVERVLRLLGIDKGGDISMEGA